MKFVLCFDEQGILRADLISVDDEQRKARQVWQAIQHEVKALDSAIRRAASVGRDEAENATSS
jgi:hypothetical protein